MFKLIKRSATVIMLSVFLLLAFTLPAVAQDITITTAPSDVKVDLNFKGATVTLSGTAPVGSDIFVKMVSPGRKVKLDKKGKVGMLWMNVGHAEVQGVPKMYQVLSTAQVSSLSKDLQRQMGIDNEYEEVFSTVTVKETVGEKHRELSGTAAAEYTGALAKMYQDSGLYKINEKGLGTKGANYYGEITLPAEVAQGESTVTVYAVQGNKLLATGQTTLKVESAGLVGFFRKMAKTNGPMYGIFAVAIALVAGLGIDFLFNFLEKLYRTLTGKVPEKCAELSADTH